MKILNILLVFFVVMGMAGISEATRTKQGVIAFYSGLTGGATGSLDAQTAPGGNWVDGDQAYGTVGGIFYVYQMDIDNAGTESTAAPWSIIDPDTEAGDERWVLVKQYGGQFSRVTATLSSGQSIPNNDTDAVLICDTEVDDILAEYNPTTGVFTALYAGRYVVTAQVGFRDATFYSSNTVICWLYKNGTDFRRGTRDAFATSNSYKGSSLACTVTLSAGDTLKIIAYQNSGYSRTTDADQCFFNVDRIQ